MPNNTVAQDQDESKPEAKESVGEKIVSTAYKIEGWETRISAIINFVVGTVFLLIAGVLSLFFKSVLLLVVASPIIILTFLGGWYYWRRGKVLVREGKFSAPWKVD